MYIQFDKNKKGKRISSQNVACYVNNTFEEP